MIKASSLVSVVVVFAIVAATYAEDKQGSANESPIVWGDVVNGLQLGIAPPVGTNGIAVTLFDGENLRARVFCRNTSEAPVRLLASVHTCLLGKGGDNSLLASGLILTPKDGGVPVTVTYQGWNHLSLLDTRRKKGEQPQQSLNKSFWGATDIQLSEADASRMSTSLEPGATGRVVQVEFTPNRKPRSWWWLKNESDALASGAYSMMAFLTVDQERSEWKGTLKSGILAVDIVLPKEDGNQRLKSPTKPWTATE